MRPMDARSACDDQAVTIELVDAGAVRLAVERHGQGDPVVLVAGIAAGREMWTPTHVVALNSAGFEVITFNNRGIAPSHVPAPPYTIAGMATDTAALIESLGLSRAGVVGFSLGALITQELALARPDLVSTAVLVGSLGRKDLTRRRLGEDAARGVTAKTPPAALSGVVRALTLFGPARLDDDVWMATYLSMTEETEVEMNDGLVGQQLASTAYDNRLAALSRIEIPCLVLSFELDVLVPAALGRELAASVPFGRYVELPGCGHGGLWEQPAETATIITDFLVAVARPKQ